MRETSIRCDVCGTIKKVSNRWCVGWVTDDIVSVSPVDSSARINGPDYGIMVDLCGVGHALQWMGVRLAAIQANEMVKPA